MWYMLYFPALGPLGLDYVALEWQTEEEVMRFATKNPDTIYFVVNMDEDVTL